MEWTFLERHFNFLKENGSFIAIDLQFGYLCVFQAIRKLETEIETTRKTMIANAGTQGLLEKQLLHFRGNLMHLLNSFMLLRGQNHNRK